MARFTPFKLLVTTSRSSQGKTFFGISSLVRTVGVSCAVVLSLVVVSPAFAQDPICNDANVFVAPGGSVNVPIDCYNTPPFVDPTQYYVKKALTTMITNKGSLYDKGRQLSLASPTLTKTTTELLYRADTTAMGVDTFQFFGHTYDVATDTPTPPGMWISKPNSTGTIMIDATGTNAPMCKDVTATVQAGNTIDIPTNCVGPLGVTLTLKTTSTPAHGKLGTPDNSKKIIPYTADRPYSGSDRFTYTASTPTQTSNEATATITITARPTPTCADITATVQAGDTIEIPTSCTDPEGKPLTLAVVAKPTHGTTGTPDNSKKTIPYTASPTYTGTDQYTYNATNPTGDTSNTATATITTTRKPDNPTTSTTTPPPPPPPSEPTPPTCKNITQKIEIPFPDYDDKTGKMIGPDPFDAKISHPLQLACNGMDGAKLTYELLETKKFGTLQNLDSATGKVNWHNVDWPSLEKEACPFIESEIEPKCDESKFPPFKSHPEDVPEDPDTHLPAVDTFYYGWDEQYRYRAVDETHSVASNEATLTIQEREGRACRYYMVGRVTGVTDDSGVIGMVRCINKDGKWETLDDPKYPLPFTIEGPPTACVKLEAGGKTPQTRSRWTRFTPKSRIQIKTPGIISRSSKGKAAFSVLVKGKKQVFPKPPRFSGPENSNKPAKPFMQLSVQIDKFWINTGKTANRLPSAAQFDPAALKPGRHTFTVTAERVTPKKRGDWKQKVLKKVSLPFTVVNCEPAKLTASKPGKRTILRATSGNIPLKSATFFLPKKLNSRTAGTPRSLKLNKKTIIKLKRVKKGNKPTVLAHKNGLTITAKGRQIIITGLPEKTTFLALELQNTRTKKRQLYKARLQTQDKSVLVSAWTKSAKRRKR